VVAFYENKPNEIRIPVADPISKRFYVKPPNWDGVLRKGRKDEQYIVNGQVIPPIACPS
jgi:hypothetical protein